MTRFLLAASLSSLVLVGCAVDPEPAEVSAAVVRADGQAPRDVLPPNPPHCIAPWGTDWTRVLGVVGADVVSPFCTQVVLGDRYVPEVLWITNTETGLPDHPVVYPDGYFPTSRAPMTDFLHKLDSVRYVVQPGGQEIVYSAAAIERGLTVNDLFAGSDEFPPEQLVFPATALLGKLPSVTEPGSYRAEIHFVMRAAHCDGQSADTANSCLPAGDTLVISRGFTAAR